MSFTLSAGKLLFELWSKRLLRCTFIAVAMGSIFLILHFNFHGGLTPTDVLEERAVLASAETYHPTTPTFANPDPSDIASFGMAACAAVAIAASITVLIRSSRRKPWVRASRSPPLSQAKKVSATPISSIISFQGTPKDSEVVLSTQGNRCTSGRPSTGSGSTRSAVDRVSPLLGIDSNRPTSTISNGWFSPQDSHLGIMKEAEGKEVRASFRYKVLILSSPNRRQQRRKRKRMRSLSHILLRMYSDPRPRVLFLEIFSVFRKRRSFVYPPLPSHSCKTCLRYLRILARSISVYVLTLHRYFFGLSCSRFQVGSDIKSIPQPSVQKTQAAAPYMSPHVCLLTFLCLPFSRL